MTTKKHVSPAASDHGTVLEPDQVAVTYDHENGYQIRLPDNDDADMPSQAVALVAAAMRLQGDEDFYNEMLSWFED